MPIFLYKGLDKTGKEIKATVNSDGLPQAKSKIKHMGIMLIDIKEQKSKTGGGFSFGKGSVSVEDLAMMTRQFATLVKAKIQIVDALAALGDQVDSAVLRVVLSEVRQKVNEGSSLAKALAEHPKIFTNVYVNMVQAGEESGTLEIVMLRLADFTEAQMKLKTKVQGAMMYPMIMVIVGFIMMNIIFIFVIPKIAKIFVSMKKELPWNTKLCIWISNFLQSYWWLTIILIFAFIWLFKKYISTKKGEKQWHNFTIKAPIFGKLVKMINVSRFCSTLGTLLNSGVPILTAMKIVSNLVGNVHMRDAIEDSRIAVSEGSSLTGPLIASGHFPPLVTHMIKLGERSGELENMLKIVSENYEDQVESKISGLTSILEPIMIVILGVTVGFVVFSVIGPMLEMNKL